MSEAEEQSMVGQIRFSAAAAVALVSLLSAVPARADADDAPGTPAKQTLSQNPNASNAQQDEPSAANLLTVPLVTNIPGGVTVPVPKSPVGDDPEAVQRGMQYFNGFNCVGCHAANGGGGMGPALSNRFFKYGSEPAQMYNVIAHGAPLGMPAWGTVLPDSAIWDIIAYIQSISSAPSAQWGTTVNADAHAPAIEQVPAEFGNTTQPWQHTQPFSSGQKPTSQRPAATEGSKAQ
jgi:cytochrome c oxidase cbb3-type subunit 3